MELEVTLVQVVLAVLLEVLTLVLEEQVELEEQVVKAEPGEPVELEATLVTQGLLETQELQVQSRRKEWWTLKEYGCQAKC